MFIFDGERHSSPIAAADDFDHSTFREYLEVIRSILADCQTPRSALKQYYSVLSSRLYREPFAAIALGCFEDGLHHKPVDGIFIELLCRAIARSDIPSPEFHTATRHYDIHERRRSLELSFLGREYERGDFLQSGAMEQELLRAMSSIEPFGSRTIAFKARLRGARSSRKMKLRVTAGEFYESTPEFRLRGADGSSVASLKVFEDDLRRRKSAISGFLSLEELKSHYIPKSLDLGSMLQPQRI